MKLTRFRVFGLFFILALVSKSCKDRKFRIDNVSEKQAFIIKKASLLPRIDPPVKVRVKGYLDGKAIVYIPNGPSGKDPFYTLKLEKGNFDRVLSRAFTYKQFSVVYEPITAQKGTVKIEVDAP